MCQKRILPGQSGSEDFEKPVFPPNQNLQNSITMPIEFKNCMGSVN